jgi:hypothetical protein
MTRRSGILVAVAAGLAALGCAGSSLGQKFSSPEETSGKTVTQAGITLPSGLYDEKADAVVDINRARERAKRDNRNVVIMWGENNCEFCVHLHRLYSEDPRIKQLMETEYELVRVDIGKFEKNIDLAKNQYQTDLLQIGAPDLTVVNPTTNQAMGVMSGKDALAKPMTLQRVFDADFVFNFLDKNKPTPKPALPMLMEAQQKAKRDDRRVLAYFNIYGSDACKAWDRVADSREVRGILEKAYVLRKLDVDRNPGGYDLLRRIKGSTTANPPWMTVLDVDGKSVAEAGAGHEFDAAGSLPSVVEWLVAASSGKLTADDKDPLTKAIENAIKPKEQPSAGAPAAK